MWSHYLGLLDCFPLKRIFRKERCVSYLWRNKRQEFEEFSACFCLFFIGIILWITAIILAGTNTPRNVHIVSSVISKLSTRNLSMYSNFSYLCVLFLQRESASPVRFTNTREVLFHGWWKCVTNFRWLTVIVLRGAALSSNIISETAVYVLRDGNMLA